MAAGTAATNRWSDPATIRRRYDDLRRAIDGFP
jgi:hypothetical protein